MSVYSQFLPEEMFKVIRLNINLIPFKNIRNYLNWDGDLTLFDMTNHMISGGAESKITKYYPVEFAYAY